MGEFFRKLFLPITAPLDFIQRYFKALLFLFVIFLIIAASSKEPLKEPNLAKIYLYGPILDTSLFLEELKKAQNNHIKGVLVIVDSPGGLISPSIEIAYALKKLSEQKKVVVYASGTMASGSYYASIYGHKIISNPGSLIGSIGVIFEGLNIQELAQKIGIKEQVIKAGKYKEAGTIMREWKEYEKAELERLVRAQYEMFVNDVAAARKLNPKEHEKFADAKIFTAKEAKEIGLIDEIGVLSDAQNSLIELAGVSEPIWQEDSEFEKFVKKIVNETSNKLMMMIFSSKMWW